MGAARQRGPHLAPVLAQGPSREYRCRMDVIRRHVVVHGQVQGIGFRFSARVEAQRLGVSGWVRNRSDGAVEAEIEGEPSAIDAMLGWFDEGPPGASVSTMSTSDLAPTGEPGFRVTY